MKFLAVLCLTLASLAWAQQPGTLTTEEHPPLEISVCNDQGCTTEQASVVIDGDSRYIYSVADGGSVACWNGAGWDATACPDPVTCAQNCALDGLTIDQYSTEHGISTSGNSLRLAYVTDSSIGRIIGSRSYLVSPDDTNYRMFYLKNREFTFDTDQSTVECGINAALYFIEMEYDGGQSAYASNNAGAKFGTGYCDAQCFHYMRFLGGEANIAGEESEYGACCVEMDIWEGNKAAQMYTTHSCNTEGYFLCQRPDECGDQDRYGGVCDKDGGAYNPYRLLAREYYGFGSEFVVDSSQPLTVVTQFITSDGTDSGDLVEIRRLYVQNGNVIQNAQVGYEEIGDYDSSSDAYISDYKAFFGENNDHANKGGMRQLGQAFDRGVVLSFSIWDDASGHMLWMDSINPPDADPNTPGVANGPCPPDGGIPSELQEQYPDTYVTFSNIKIGTIGSTY